MSEPAEHRVAAALQRVLLPPGLPEVASWGMATLYEPAGETVLVGGDFYDWFTLPNGHVLFFVGDVSGKGPVAGALGMSIRKALKGITWVTQDALAALPLLQQALADEFQEAFATLCLFDVTPGEGLLRLVLAGHPPPWLRHDGTFTEIDAPANGVLGPDLQADWRPLDLELAPGDMIVVFSDGLTEARLPDGRLFGEGPFEALLSALPASLSSYEAVLQVEENVRRVATGFADDVIIGVLTFQPPEVSAPERVEEGEIFRLRLSADSSSVGLARSFVADACRRLGASEAVALDAELIASELVTNAVLHARTAIEVRVAAEDRGIRIEVQDTLPVGPAFGDPPGLPAATLEHGRGLAVVRHLARDLGVTPTEGGKAIWAVVSAQQT